MVDCPDPYIDVPGLDKSAEILGPFGTLDPDFANIHNGKCLIDSGFFTNFQVATIAKCATDSFTGNVKRSFFWTAKN